MTLHSHSRHHAPGEHPRSVVILTAAVGGGHDGPARELARRLDALGHHVRVVDLVTMAPLGLGRLLKAIFKMQLRLAPSSWGRVFCQLENGRTVPVVVRAISRLAAGGVGRILQGQEGGEVADVVVGTFPAAGHVVAATRRGGVRTPLVTYITDPAVHRLWISADAELYLTTWPTGPAAVAVHTATPTLAVAPAVRAEFRPDVSDAAMGPAEEVALFGRALPRGPLALLSSGSWAVGDVYRTALDILTHTHYTPVVVCGTNERLRRRLAAVPGVAALGWIDEMAALMRRCDLAVLNSGGLTLAEAASSGLPIIHYRPLHGQGEANARACEAAGVAPYPRTRQDLVEAGAVAAGVGAPALPEDDPVVAILAVAAGPAAHVNRAAA